MQPQLKRVATHHRTTPFYLYPYSITPLLKGFKIIMFQPEDYRKNRQLLSKLKKRFSVKDNDEEYNFKLNQSNLGTYGKRLWNAFNLNLKIFEKCFFAI